jgi:biotin carboxyl carrier protein
VNLRSLAAAALAVPILAIVYVRAATRSRRAIRLALVAGVASLAVTASAATLVRPPSSEALRAATPAPPPAASSSIAAVEGKRSPDPMTAAFVSAARPTGAVVRGSPPPDRAGEVALAASVLPPPSVIRFRPRDGSSVVDAPLEVSVRFTQPMDVASTTPAFSVAVDGTAWSGKARWAEANMVLVVRLPKRPPAGASVRLTVADAARSVSGTPLGGPVDATFTVATPPPPPSPTPRPAATARPSATPRPPTTPAATSAGWTWPLIGRITQRFGESLTKYGFHQGIDIDGDTGDPVRAARAGRVTLAGRGDSCGGIQVHIDHGGGIETWYRHLSAVSVKVGQQVTGGQVVGRVGNTGCSLGSHLHFSVRRSGTFVDPLRYLPPR